MAVFRKDVLLCLAFLVSSAEATSFSDPVICYVLDAVLLLYCIIFTALYFKLKFEKAKSFAKAPDKATSGDEAAEQEGEYQTLSVPSNDDYQKIQIKDRPHKKRSKSIEPKSKRNAAESIEMKPAPPLPTRG